jgi:hypothetical protein
MYYTTSSHYIFWDITIEKIFFLEQQLTFCVVEERGPRDFKPRGDGEYRRHDDKKAGAAGDFNPQFRGGVGRGAPTF